MRLHLYTDLVYERYQCKEKCMLTPSTKWLDRTVGSCTSLHPAKPRSRPVLYTHACSQTVYRGRDSQSSPSRASQTASGGEWIKLVFQLKVLSGYGVI